VILPEIFPIIQEKLLGTDAFNATFGLAPLQMVAVAGEVTSGEGLTVKVIVCGEPTHAPAVDSGVIIYSTVPGKDVLGLVRIWLILDPAPSLAPVILPAIVPIVQEKMPGVEDVNIISGLVPLQVAAVIGEFTTGEGLTVIVIVKGVPGQELANEVGVTI
jgi:ABC-type proline/glycine betaine transport system permease subunit